MGDECLWRAKSQRLVWRTKDHKAALSPIISSPTRLQGKETTERNL